MLSSTTTHAPGWRASKIAANSDAIFELRHSSNLEYPSANDPLVSKRFFCKDGTRDVQNINKIGDVIVISDIVVDSVLVDDGQARISRVERRPSSKIEVVRPLR